MVLETFDIISCALPCIHVIHQSVVSCNKPSQFWGAAYPGPHVSGILTVLLGPFPTTQHCGKLTPQVVFRTFAVSFGVGVLLIREAI